MYGLWILFIVFAAIFVFCLLLAVLIPFISSNMSSHTEDVVTTTLGIPAAICLFILIFLMPIAISLPLGAEEKVNYWREFSTMATAIYSNTSDLSDIYTTSEIIEYNAWLAEARASQQTYGNWSSYYKLDLSDLQYIGVGE